MSKIKKKKIDKPTQIIDMTGAVKEDKDELAAGAAEESEENAVEEEAEQGLETAIEAEAAIKTDGESETEVEEESSADDEAEDSPETEPRHYDEEAPVASEFDKITIEQAAGAASSGMASDIAALRDELAQLREQYDSRRELYERISRECDEFKVLFPGQQIKNLPVPVWERVKVGMPISAAFAYEEAIRRRRDEEAALINRKNNENSAGAIVNRAGAGFFSQSEVKSMSAAEIKANYTQIMESMKTWS